MTPLGPDLLVQGDDAPARRLRRAPRAAALGAAAVLVAVVAVVALVRSAEREPQTDPADRDVLRLVLSSRQDGAPRYGPRSPGMHVVIANQGRADVELVAAGLIPGSWGVEIPDRRLLRAGRSAVVELVPPPGCALERPRLLQVRALLASGRTRSATLDVTDAALAHGGRLEDALAAAALTCDPRVPPPSDRRTYPHRS